MSFHITLKILILFYLYKISECKLTYKTQCLCISIYLWNIYKTMLTIMNLTLRFNVNIEIFKRFQ